VQELVRQVAVRAVNLDAVEPGWQRRSAPARNSSMMSGISSSWKSTGHGERDFAPRRIGMTFRRNRGGRNRRIPVGLQVGMRLTPDMPQLKKNPTPFT
jgi:hypothetical protein